MVPNALLLLSLLAASANGAHGGATHRQRRATRVPRIGNAAGQICRTRPSAESGRTFQRLAAEGGGYSACTKEDAYAYIHAHQDNGSGSGAAQASIAPSTSSEQPVASAAADTKAPTDIYTDPDNINRVPVNNIKFNAPAVTVNSGAGLTPNGIKAGISAGDAYDAVKDHIGWWYDWSPNPPSRGAPIAVPMLWGAGTVDHTDWQRYEDFKKLGGNPPYIIGFEEPDCAAGGGSAGMDVDTAARVWNELMAPWAGRTVLISPSMCHQYAETYLEPFFSKIDSSAVQVINVHINKKSGDEKSIDYYYNKYGKPIWVTEFACVDDVNGFNPCTDQGEIDRYIWEAVQIFESDSRVAAYAYSNGVGLGDVWPMWRDGHLTRSGQTYLNAISQYH